MAESARARARARLPDRHPASILTFASSARWLLSQTIMHGGKSSLRSDHDLRSEIKFFLTVWQNERGYFRKVLIRL